MSLLILGLIVFIGVHLVPVMTGLRRSLVQEIGETGVKMVVTIISVVGLALIVYGYGAARAAGPMILWDPPVWTRHIAATLMIPVMILWVAAYAPVGRIKPAVKHPMILAVKIWAFAHLVANGTAPDLALFGAFLAWGVVDRISLKRRDLAAGGARLVAGPVQNDLIAVIGGLVLWAAFAFYLHEWLFGVAPFG